MYFFCLSVYFHYDRNFIFSVMFSCICAYLIVLLRGVKVLLIVEKCILQDAVQPIFDLRFDMYSKTMDNPVKNKENLKFCSYTCHLRLG